eukprot:gene9291-1379_t
MSFEIQQQDFTFTNFFDDFSDAEHLPLLVEDPLNLSDFGGNFMHEVWQELEEITKLSPKPILTENVYHSTKEDFKNFIPLIANIPLFVDESNPTKIEKQQKTKNTISFTSGMAGKKRNFKNDKIRSILPKRCGDVNCKHSQHFKSEKEAIENKSKFKFQQGRSTCCTCGKTIQYRVGQKWLRSGGLSAHLQKYGNK